MRKIIYADNAATTKIDMDAFDAMKRYLVEEFGNASQPYTFAKMAKKALADARAIITKMYRSKTRGDIFYFWWHRKRQLGYKGYDGP